MLMFPSAHTMWAEWKEQENLLLFRLEKVHKLLSVHTEGEADFRAGGLHTKSMKRHKFAWGVAQGDVQLVHWLFGVNFTQMMQGEIFSLSV